MKRFFLIVAAVAAFALPSLGEDGHKLTKLWKEYQAAADADKPLTQIEILGRIKSQAKENNYAWDFWDAARTYIEVSVHRDWRLRDSLEKAVFAEADSFPDPVVGLAARRYYDNILHMFYYATEYREALEKGHNQAFYQSDSYVKAALGGTLPRYIKSDYEYALWAKALSRYTTSREYSDSLLTACLGDTYPTAPYFQYVTLTRDDVDEEELTALAQKYSGKAISMYPLGALLSEEVNEAVSDTLITQEEYKALRDKAAGLEKTRKSFKGKEGDIVEEIDIFRTVVDYFDQKDANFYISGENMTVLFKNVKSATFSMADESDKILYSKKVDNPGGRYFIVDTVSVKIPDLGDGVFKIILSCPEAFPEEDNRRTEFSRYSYALAFRGDGNNQYFFTANAATGLPVKDAKLVIDTDEDEVYATGKDAAGITRRSPSVWAPLDDDGYSLFSSDKPYTKGRVFLNTSAYRLGDTIRYKALLYTNFANNTKTVFKEGMPIEVKVLDPHGEDVAAAEETTNSYGTISGTFVLPEDAISGFFSISVYSEGHYLGSTEFYYGDFTLPSFVLEVEPFSYAVMEGDTAHIKAHLTGYSGHTPSSAEVKYRIRRFSGISAFGTAKVEEGGDINIDFFGSEGYYLINFDVSDATGESLSFDSAFYIGKNVYFHVETPDFDPNYSLGRGFTAGKVCIKDNMTMNVAALANEIPVKDAAYNYVLEDSKGKVVRQGKAVCGQPLSLDLKGLGTGKYRFVVKSSEYKRYSGEPVEEDLSFVRFVPGGPVPSDIDCLFFVCDEKVPVGGKISFFAASGTHPIWALTELYGEGGKVLYSEVLYFAKGKSAVKSIPYLDSYGDDVSFKMLFFYDYTAFQNEKTLYLDKHTGEIPLTVTSIPDYAKPGETVTVELQTAPGAELVASVWDKATDAVKAMKWTAIRFEDHLSKQPYMGTGVSRPGESRYYRAYGYEKNEMLYDEVAEVSAMSAEPNLYLADDQEDGGEEVSVRQDFSEAIFFEPHMVADSDGKVSFGFKASDKLSTFYVAVFAHDKDVHNNTLTKELLITIPIKVDMYVPSFLYEGDKYVPSVSVSSNRTEETIGLLSVIGDESREITVPGRGSVGAEFSPVTVTSQDSGSMNLKAIFKGEGYSDGVSFDIPVLARHQTLTESHSAVFTPDKDRAVLLDALRSRFTGTTAVGVVTEEISILDMVKSLLEEHIDTPSQENALSLSEALYVRNTLEKLCPGRDVYGDISKEVIIEKLFALQNGDGGFPWLKGFKSSPYITATVLDRLARVGLESAEQCAKAVLYLDGIQFTQERPWWMGGLSNEQYLLIRSRYSGVAFETPGKEASKRFTAFKKFTKSFLTPSGKRALEGRIMEKARRLATLQNLVATPQGVALAKKWGIKTSSKLEKSLKADIASLVEYAVDHRDGGCYFPNAVMPWRGLIESEAYAHTLLAGVLSDTKVADGVRLWLMLQKETQDWDLTPFYVSALDCILSGSEELLATKVVTLTKTYRKPLEEISAAGNGITIDTEYYLRADSDGTLVPIEPGDTLGVGARVVVYYRISSLENRSYVKMRVPRYATLRPVEQLSGLVGWDIYREVRSTCTDYYFDVLAESKTIVTEEFFVTQKGEFASAAAEIESLYAPHYRANSAFAGLMVIE